MKHSCRRTQKKIRTDLFSNASTTGLALERGGGVSNARGALCWGGPARGLDRSAREQEAPAWLPVVEDLKRTREEAQVLLAERFGNEFAESFRVAAPGVHPRATELVLEELGRGPAA